MSEEFKKLVRGDSSVREGHVPDIRKIRAWLNARGLDAEPSDIEWAWQQHSDCYAAGWLNVDSEDEAVSVVIRALLIKEL